MSPFQAPTVARTVQFMAYRLGKPLVYFAQWQEDGLIKIGTSQCVSVRISQLGAVRLLGTVPGGFAKERQIHKRFRAHRRTGEWYEPAEPILAYVDRYGEKRLPPAHQNPRSAILIRDPDLELKLAAIGAADEPPSTKTRVAYRALWEAVRSWEARHPPRRRRRVTAR